MSDIENLRIAWTAFQRHACFGTLHTGRYHLPYFTWGNGPPLVFIHGMADAARSFIMVMHRLVDCFTCIGYDLPNGITDGARFAPYRHREYVADVLTLLDHLGHKQVRVVGSSFGSTIAIAALAAHPERFTRGILQGGFARRPLMSWQRRLCQMARYWPGWFGSWPGIYGEVMARVERPTRELLSPEMNRWFLKCGGRTPLRAAALRTLTIGTTDLRGLLPGIRTPILLVGGDRDPLVSRSREAELEAGLPDVRRVEFAPCGHYPHFTHPAALAEEISRFCTP